MLVEQEWEEDTRRDRSIPTRAARLHLWRHRRRGVPIGPGGASAAASIQSLKDNMVRLANQEWERWGRGTIKEWEERIRPVLQDYWLTGTGTRFSEPGWWSKHAWSAAFTSWIMKKAGA